MPKYFTKIP